MMHRPKLEHVLSILIATVFVAAGCGKDDSAGDAGDGSVTDGGGTSDGDVDTDTDTDVDADSDTDTDNDTDTDTDTDSDTDTDTDTDADTDLDAGNDGGSDGGSETSNSCREVDVVIAVDASGSMYDELLAMRQDVFPAFASTLIDISEGLDSFRIATIDACPDPATFHTQGQGGNCNFNGGNVWIESESPTINEEFACVGDIYLDDINCDGNNDDEQPASAAAASLESPFLQGENAGFLRDSALLVVIAITDEDEQPTGAAQTEQELYNRLIALKGGDVERMVFLGIGGSANCTGVYGSAGHAMLLQGVTDQFVANQRGVWWDLCVGNLEDGLADAFDVIEQACDELPPVV